MADSVSTTLKFEVISTQSHQHVTRLVGYVKLRNYARIISSLDLDANPRASKTGKVTKAIQESLTKTPATFPFKTKGILLGCSEYKEVTAQAYELKFIETNVEGILDGGHNSLALGLEILALADIEFARVRKASTWSEFKEIWNENQSAVEDFVSNSNAPQLDVLLPVEILVPTNTDNVSAFNSSLLDICAARNNNAQLRAETKANQTGYFDGLKKHLPQYISDNVEWKTNAGGKIKATDIVAMAWVPLSVLNPVADEDGKAVEAPNPQSLYSGKGDLMTRFERLMSSPEVTESTGEGYERLLISPQVESAFKLTADVVELHDYIYAKFPEAYNKQAGKFGRLTAVKKVNASSTKKKTKFTGEEVQWVIPDGFVMPLVYGLTELIDANEDGTLYWTTDPKVFLEEHLSELVGDMKPLMEAYNFDPQKVGKAAGTYDMVAKGYERELRNLSD